MLSRICQVKTVYWEERISGTARIDTGYIKCGKRSIK